MKNSLWIRNGARGLMILLVGWGFAQVAATAVNAKPNSPQTSAQFRGLNFSHTLHVETNGMECSACHGAVERSNYGGDHHLPSHAQCMECHDVETSNACGTCHLNASPAPQPKMTEFSPKFSHLRHVQNAKLECAQCHANLDAPLTEGRTGHFPHMNDCMECHDQRGTENECATCHMPQETLTPKDHALNWLNKHGAIASAEDETSCNQCHGRSQVVSCQSCHTGDQVFFPHPRNYIARHAQDARLSDLNCATCHDRQDDCNACHRQLNVIPGGHFKPGWVNRTDGGDHRDQAQFELESCMSCHDTPQQAPTCIRCHGK